MDILLNELSLGDCGTIATSKVLEEFLHSLKRLSALPSVGQPIFFAQSSDIHSVDFPFIGQNSLHQLATASPEIRSAILAFLAKLHVLDECVAPVYVEERTGLSNPSFSAFRQQKNVDSSLCFNLLSSRSWMHGDITHRRKMGGPAITMPCMPPPKFENVKAALAFNLPLLMRVSRFAVAQPNVALPKSRVSNYLIGDPQFDVLYQSSIRATPQARTAAFKAIGTAVAEINDYAYDQPLSARNRSGKKLRTIFSNQDRTFFLSIDFETGAFEVMDGTGRHLGEINFAGNQTKKADPKGGHDIELN
jgi:hypothetical protein